LFLWLPIQAFYGVLAIIRSLPYAATALNTMAKNARGVKTMPRPHYPELETERLRLRYWRESDITAYAALCADAQTMQYLGGVNDRLESWRHMAVMVGHWQLKGYGHWVVEEKASGLFVGRVGFLKPDGWPGFELGWTIARPHWRQGFAYEAASCALAYAFNQTERMQVISLIDPDNFASIAVAKKLGQGFFEKTELMGKMVDVYKIDRPLNL